MVIVTKDSLTVFTTHSFMARRRLDSTAWLQKH
jgi:hypothetical protein